jgi:hypothetical protein
MPFQSQSTTALRRLMTEYKQLTAGGSPDGMFTAGMDSFLPNESLTRPLC